jgi:hypothetical protein
MLILKNHPSLFIYAILDYPLGGTSFFFVTGLATGFGYNRTLKVPTIDQIATFPSSSRAVSPLIVLIQTKPPQLTGELTKLRDYIPRNRANIPRHRH